jgi:hypothetical protein
MIKVWMLLLSLFSLSAYSAEFNHIKLKPQFEQYLTQPKLKSTGAKSMGLRSTQNEESAQIENALRTSLLGTSLSKSNWSNPIPVDGEESLLYEEIRRHLEASHREIGLGQVHQINLINRQFGLGAQNFSGFSWQKPFGVIQVYADRQVTPNLFGENWLIQDTFTFEVEAATFLEKLNEAGLADMSAIEIGAFAGITFRRVYTYYHYAASYDEGLGVDFSRLFLPFTRFNKNGIERMGNEEIIKREDNWSARAGGLIATPPISNISFSTGVLAEYSFQQTTTVQSSSSESNEDHRFRLGVVSKTTKEVGATMGLQLDFFKLIKLSLLQYDLNYEYASGKEFTLGFTSTDWEEVKQEPELTRILRGSGNVRNLEPYVIRLDESSSSSTQSRASVLLWGKLQKSKTEQIRVIKDQMVRVFYKNYAQSIRVVQNFWSRIFSAVIYKILKLPINTNNAAMYMRQLTMEYEATHPQATNPSISRIESAEQFSFVLTQSYDAAKTTRWIDKKFKNDVIWFIDVYTTLPKDYKSIVRSEQLQGPMRVESNLRVEKVGFDHLLSLSEDSVFGSIADVCRSRKKDDWISESKRRKLMRRWLLGREGCVKMIGQKYLSLKEDYLAHQFKPSLARFKDFITKYYKQSGGISDLTALFGSENVFVHGRLQARTSQGAHFDTSFSSGQFRGLGVIDNFKRASGSRAPASIVSE